MATHRVVAAAASPVFKEEIERATKEGAVAEIQVDADPDICQMLLHYIYLGSVTVPAEKVQAFTDAAAQYKVSGFGGYGEDDDEDEDDGDMQQDKVKIEVKKEPLARGAAASDNSSKPGGHTIYKMDLSSEKILELEGGRGKCLLCSAEFSQVSNARRHFLLRHGDAPKAECPICKKIFKNVDSMKRHMRHAHKIGQKDLRRAKSLKRLQ